MLKQLAVISSILLYFSLSGCSSHTNISQLEKSGGKQLSGAEILERVEGNTLLLNSFEMDGYLFFDQSGKLFAKDLAHNKDLGHWDVNDADQLCLKLKAWWYGELNCYTLWNDHQDKTTFQLANKNGLLKFRATQSQGDSQRLFAEPKKRAKSMGRSIRSKKSSKTNSQNSQQQQAAQTPGVEPGKPVVAAHYATNAATVAQDNTTTMELVAKNCPGCNLSFADLKGANLAGANLEGANLEGADLSGANLRRANLRGAKLENANLASAELPGTDLSNSNLKNANLKGANLYKANLTGALTTGASLNDAHLKGLH